MPSKYREMKLRRKELMAQMEPNSIALLASAPPRLRNNDAEYPYRQNSDFYYLTGFREEHAFLALIPGRKQGESEDEARATIHDDLHLFRSMSQFNGRAVATCLSPTA